MLFDLHPQSDMTPTVGLLFAAVVENFNRLKSITAGMNQDELDYKGIDGQYNSTAQLILHLMNVDIRWVYRIKEETIPESLLAYYGPMLDDHHRLPMIHGVALDELLHRYDDIIAQLKDVCIELSEHDLSNTVTFGHQNEKQATIKWGIWHIADHSRYHQAHITQLRKWYLLREVT